MPPRDDSRRRRTARRPPPARGRARATPQAPEPPAGQVPAPRQAPVPAATYGQATGRERRRPGGTARQGGAGRHRRTPEKQASYREVFAIREFRGLWAAQVLSYGGDQFAQVAIAILVYHQTHSPFLTALAYAFTYLPPIIGGPFLSGLADFIPRRHVMIACDIIRAGLVGLMAIPAIPLPRAVRPAVLHRAARRAVLVGAHGDCSPTCCPVTSSCLARRSGT